MRKRTRNNKTGKKSEKEHKEDKEDKVPKETADPQLEEKVFYLRGRGKRK